MIPVIGLTIIVALFALGMWFTFGEGEIFHTWYKVVTKYLPVWAQKPLATCPRCMCSVFGAVAICWVYFIPDPFVWLICIPCAVGLQEMMHR